MLSLSFESWTLGCMENITQQLWMLHLTEPVVEVMLGGAPGCGHLWIQSFLMHEEA